MAEDLRTPSPGAPGAPAAPGAAAAAVADILHVDMDAFFASVEVLDDPGLAGRPVIVGGSGARGVVAACTYEARVFGVRSAMPSTRARRLCPEAVFLDGRHDRYAQVSGQLHEIFRSFTPLVEGISLDEAFLDVGGATALFGGPVEIARAIRSRVATELGLACSVGVARTKLLAKLASKAAKPKVTDGALRPGAGVIEVPPGEELAFLHPLPVGALWGVGPATREKLERVGVRTIGDLAGVPEPVLVRLVGAASGAQLARLAWGRDGDPVSPDRPVKSVGHEETFPRDLRDGDELAGHVLRMADAVVGQLRGSGLAGRAVTLKLRFGDFTTITRSRTLDVPIDTTPALCGVARHLLAGVDVTRGVRLLGVSVSGFGSAPVGGPPPEQLAFEVLAPGRSDPAAGGSSGSASDGRSGAAPARRAEAGRRGGPGAESPTPAEVGAASAALQATWAGIARAVDAVRSRYGDRSVGPAALLGADGLRLRRRGEAQWGPRATPDAADGDP